MAAVQLDDEFVSYWKEWIGVHPRAISSLLTKGIEGAHVDAAIYGEGSGTFELRARTDQAEPSLLHLRFSFPEETMFIDEIRIAEARRGTGLFQRMIFNTEEVASAMGLRQVRVLATGMGGYALAAVGRYPQPM